MQITQSQHHIQLAIIRQTALHYKHATQPTPPPTTTVGGKWPSASVAALGRTSSS